MPFTRTVAAVFLALLAPITFAQGTKSSSEFSRCIDRAGAVDPAIIECMSAEFSRQDRLLNQTYKKLLAQLSPVQARKLQEAQRLWVKYTESNCAFYYDPDGGTSARQSASQCAIDARVSRTKELEGFLQEHDH